MSPHSKNAPLFATPILHKRTHCGRYQDFLTFPPHSFNKHLRSPPHISGDMHKKCTDKLC